MEGLAASEPRNEWTNDLKSSMIARWMLFMLIMPPSISSGSQFTTTTTRSVELNSIEFSLVE